MSRASPGAVAETSLTNGVSIGLPSASRCATTVALAPAGTSTPLASMAGSALPGLSPSAKTCEVVAAGGQLQRVGEGAGLEVGDQLLAVGVDVDGQAGHGVQDRDGRVLGGCRGREGSGGENRHGPGDAEGC